MEVLERHIVRITLEENKKFDLNTKIYLIKCIFNEKKIWVFEYHIFGI